jgi:hypothetical protein
MIRIFLAGFWKDTKSFFSELLPKKVFSARAIFLLFITLAAAIYRLSEIGSGISYDEAYTYLAFIRGSLLQSAMDYHLPNNHIFLSLILNLVFHSFGGDLWILRMPTLIVGVLMIPATYALGKRLYNPETGILAAIAVALFPELIHFSAVFRGYIFVAFFTLVVFILGDDLRREKNRFRWLVLIIVFILALYTIPTMLFPFAIFYYWLLFSALVGDFGESYSNKWDFLRYWFASGILTGLGTFALYLPIFIFSRDDLFNHHWLIPVPWDVLPNRMWGKLLNTWAEWTVPIPLWLAWLGVFGGILALLLHKKLSKHKFPLQIAFLLGIVTMILIQRPNAWPRVWSFSIALLVIWAAAGLVGGLGKLKIRQISVVWILIGVASVTLFWGAAQRISQLSIYPTGKSNVEASADFLTEELNSGDMILMDGSHAPFLEYHLYIQGDFEGYFNREKEYQRIILIVVEKNDENLDVLLRKFSEKYKFDIDTLKMLRNFGNYQIYEVFPLE